MFDLIREIGQTLRNNKLRTALTGISVAWGVFMLILLLGVARGVINSNAERMNSGNNSLISYYGGRTSVPYKGYPKGRQIQLKEDDMSPLRQENEHVKRTGVSAETQDTIFGTKGIVSGLTATFPGKENERRMALSEGRFLNQRDIDDCRRAIVISRPNAIRLFSDSTAIVGRTLRIYDLSWTVVGMYEHRWISDSYIPYTTYKALTGNDDQVYELSVYFDDAIRTEEQAEDFNSNMLDVLGRRHTVAPEDVSVAFHVWNRFADSLQQMKMADYLNIAVWILGFLTLLTGIVGVSNIMFVSVRERTHEIGVRRAIGAKPRSILTQILAESVAITALFGYIGVFFGMLVLQAVDFMTRDVEFLSNPTVDIRIAVEVTIALVIAGACAGFFPALKAIKVKPVEALRDE